MNLVSILTSIPQKKLNSPPRFAILRDFQNQGYRLQFRNPEYDWQKNNETKNIGNRKALCVSKKSNKLKLLKSIYYLEYLDIHGNPHTVENVENISDPVEKAIKKFEFQPSILLIKNEIGRNVS